MSKQQSNGDGWRIAGAVCLIAWRVVAWSVVIACAVPMAVAFAALGRARIVPGFLEAIRQAWDDAPPLERKRPAAPVPARHAVEFTAEDDEPEADEPAVEVDAEALDAAAREAVADDVIVLSDGTRVDPASGEVLGGAPVGAARGRRSRIPLRSGRR